MPHQGLVNKPDGTLVIDLYIKQVFERFCHLISFPKMGGQAPPFILLNFQGARHNEVERSYYINVTLLLISGQALVSSRNGMPRNESGSHAGVIYSA